MALPIIVAVEDDGDAREDLQRDLAKRYSADYEVLTGDSPERGLELLTRAQREKTEVAIVIASLRLTAMGGVDFLIRAHELHPMARRALLIRVSDGEALAVMEQAFTLNQVDSYITKPWEPAEEWLHSTVGDLLRDLGRVAEAGP